MLSMKKCFVVLLVLAWGHKMVTADSPERIADATQARADLLTIARADIEHRREQTRRLVAMLDRRRSSEERAMAIYLLGEMRATEAIPQLVDELDLAPLKYADEFGNGVPWSQQPAKDALIAIGSPAVPEMIRVLATK